MCRFYIILFVSMLFSVGTHAQGFREISQNMTSGLFCIDQNQMSGGIIVFDYNQDNYQDILILGGELPNTLLRNNWDGTYANVTSEAGLMFDDIHTVGGVAGDIDNDGDQDLFITTAKDQPNILMINNGEGLFNNIAREAGLLQRLWSTSATMADYDLDGDVDIYVANYVNFQSLPFDADVDNCYPNFLLKNNGDNTFENVAPTLGVDNAGCGLATTFTDFDNDSDLDLFVINDFGLNVSPNEIYINEYPNEKFTKAGAALDADDRINGMGIAKGDFDKDLDLDYYITNIADNPLLENINEGDFFNDISLAEGISNPDGTSWGAVFSDINNDSFLDLIVANGQVIAADYQNNENRLFLGNDDGTFDNKSESYGIANDIRSRGLVVADLNNDGHNDLLFASVSSFRQRDYKTIVYENNIDHSNNWLKLKLQGVQSARDGYGSRIYIHGDGNTQMREVDGGSSYLSHHAGITHFGLGQTDEIDVTIVWPGGNTTEVSDIPVNSFITISEDGDWYINQNQELEAFIGDEVVLGDLSVFEEGDYTHFEENDNGETVRMVTRLTLVEKPIIINELSIKSLGNLSRIAHLIEYELPTASRSSFKIYDYQGRLLSHIDKETQLPGKYFLDTNAYRNQLSSGVYIVTLETPTSMVYTRFVIF